MLLFLLFLCGLGGAFPYENRSFWDQVILLPFNDHGWFAIENQRELEQIITEHDPQVVVELGSWLGLSSRFIGSQLTDGALLYCIDSWEQYDVSWKGDENNPANWQPGNLNAYGRLDRSQFHQFLSNVKHAGLEDKIIPVRMRTHEAASMLNMKIDLLYIDASHDEESVYQDIMDWYPKLAQDGVICGDDYITWPGVKLAVERAAKELGREVVTVGQFWRFR